MALERFLGMLKITGLTALMFAGTICESIGIPLHFIGKGKKTDAVEIYTNSEEYKIVRELEDARIDSLHGKLEELELSYQAGDILKPEYTKKKEGYEKDIEDSEKNFFEESMKKSENEEVKALLKSSKNYNIASIVLMVAGGLTLGAKVFCMIGMSLEDGMYSSIDTNIAETIGEIFEYDVAPELVDFIDRKRREREERKEEKAKEEEEKEKQEQAAFSEDEEEVLGNIEDTCYRE